MEAAIIGHPQLEQAREIAAQVESVHFPTAYPEVFRRTPGGFDVILGNPPWDKVRHEPQQYWVVRHPGLNALPASARSAAIDELRSQDPVGAAEEERERQSRERLQRIAKAGYRRLGTGHYDFAKLFAERFSVLLRRTGHLGVVLPQGCLLLGGWTDLRRVLTAEGAVSAVEARNAAGWLFEDVHFSTSVVLLAVGRVPDGDVTIYPGATSRLAFDARFDAPIKMTHDEVASISETLALPWFNSSRDTDPFNTMRGHTTLGSGEGWIAGRTDTRWDFSGSGAHREFTQPHSSEGGYWRVLKTRHVDAFRITDDPFDKQVDAASLVGLGRGVNDYQGQPSLDGDHPCIVYRFPSRNDDSRTLIATALPGEGYLYSTGYCHGIRHPKETPLVRKLALLGYLNTAVADWWVRRFVDRHVGSKVIGALVLPDWTQEDIECASAATRELLIEGGVTVLPGGLLLAEVLPDLSAPSEPRVALDVMAATGLGLHPESMEVIFQDFSNSEAAFTAEYRRKVLDGLS